MFISGSMSTGGRRIISGMTCWTMCGFKPANKSRNNPDTCLIGQLRNNNSWLDGTNVLSRVDTKVSLASLYEARVDGEHVGWWCSKIFTARTDSIFSQLNGRGLDEGGLTCDTCWSPMESCHSWSAGHQNPIRATNQCGHSLHSISPTLNEADFVWEYFLVVYYDIYLRY